MWDWLFQFVDPFEKAAVPYAIVGAVASSVYGEPQAVIVHKLRFFREGGGEKHLRDIRSMLTVGGNEIDRALIEQAVAKLNLLREWSEAQGTS